MCKGKRKGGEGVRGAEMVVVSIGQRNTALRVLLKRPHKPELSPVGGRALTLSHTGEGCRLYARLGRTRTFIC